MIQPPDDKHWLDKLSGFSGNLKDPTLMHCSFTATKFVCSQYKMLLPYISSGTAHMQAEFDDDIFF